MEIRPEVSVVIPTHNRAPILRECLDSVLAQSFESYEVIVVNDASTDATRQILKRYQQTHGGRIHVVRGSYGAPGLTRNAGAARASGNYLLFTDDDCRVPKDWIATMLETLHQRGADALSGGFEAYRLQTPAERYQHYRMRMLFGDTPKWVHAAPVINFLVPAQIFHETGGFPSHPWESLEDWALCFRLKEAGYQIFYDPAVKVTHRYKPTWRPVHRALRDTARRGPDLCQSPLGRVVMGGKAVIKYGSAPFWIPCFFPLDLYISALYAEHVFFWARMRAMFTKRR